MPEQCFSVLSATSSQPARRNDGPTNPNSLLRSAIIHTDFTTLAHNRAISHSPRRCTCLPAAAVASKMNGGRKCASRLLHTRPQTVVVRPTRDNVEDGLYGYINQLQDCTYLPTLTMVVVTIVTNK